ncbi:MAG: PAP2 family protein [Methanobacterium sp.]
MKYLITDNSKERFAEFISNIAYAPIISIPVFLLINIYLLNLHDFIIITTVCILFAGLMPILLVLAWLKSRRRDDIEIDMDIPERTERFYPLLMVITSYALGTILLYLLNAPLITTVLMFCYFTNTLAVFFINLYWKISIHAMGITGPVVALIFVFGPLGTIFALLVPLVMWSRLYLKEHTFSQVIMGAMLGFTFTTLQIYIFI